MSSHDKSADVPDAPPSYAVATGSTATSQPSSHGAQHGAHLGVPAAPQASRKSMEDELRPLPHGWVRQWDTHEQHQFFVDTKADPPRSLWIHPLDDDEVWKSLPSEEKERLQAAEDQMRRPKTPTDHKDEKAGAVGTHHTHEDYPSELPPRPSGPHSTPSHSGGQKKQSLGERLKTKVTGLTKEEREQERAQQAEQERQYYEMHQRFRAAMQRAQMTGQPQWFAKDKNGQDIYIEPPSGPGYGMGGGYPNRGYGYNPYTSGPYSAPNARFIRPGYGYGRPGYGGGGMGMAGPMML